MIRSRLLCTLVLASCVTSAFADNAASKQHPHRVLDDVTIQIDGKTRHYYHLHDAPADGRATTILLINGSGCAPFGPRVPSFFEQTPAPVDVYFLEKIGVNGEPKPGPASTSCSREFIEADYLESRVADTLAFLGTEPHLKEQGAHGIAALGFSEGGVVAPIIAARSQKIGWLVTGGAGGLPQGQSFLRFADRGVPPYAKPMSHDLFVETYAAIAADPNSLDKEFFGHSYKYWSTHLFYDPLTTYAMLDIPMLTAMGEKDESESIESGHALRDYFAKHPEKNFTFVEYPGGAHNLNAPGKQNLQDFIAALPKWFKGQRDVFVVAQSNAQSTAANQGSGSR